MIVSYCCWECIEFFDVDVDYTPESKPYSIGEYGPYGASFVDPSEIDDHNPHNCPSCGAVVDVQTLQETCDGLYGGEY